MFRQFDEEELRSLLIHVSTNKIDLIGKRLGIDAEMVKCFMQILLVE